MIKTFFLKLLVRLYVSTFRYRVSGVENVFSLMKEKKRIVFSIWHNSLVCVIAHNYGFNVAAMVSRSQDGGYFTTIMESYGHAVVRASSSKGAAAGTLEIIEYMNKGYHVAMASDGPKGPRFKLKSGVLYLAKKTDGIIIPVLANCTSFIKFRSWDGFILPKPFARIDIKYADPIYVSESIEKEDLKKDLLETQEKIMELTRVYSKDIL